jgi:hypothetical protein
LPLASPSSSLSSSSLANMALKMSIPGRSYVKTSRP